MRLLILGDAKVLSNSLVLEGHQITMDPGDDVDAVVSDAIACSFAPGGIPLIVLGTGTIVDWTVKQKRPDAEIVKTPEEVLSRLQDKEKKKELSLRQSDGSEKKFILTYSNKGGVGKTTAAVSIAQVLAECGVKTVVCDFDIGGPDVTGYFNLKPDRGLESLDSVDVFSLLIKVTDKLWVLPGPVGGEAVRFSGNELVGAVTALQQEFIVVGDTPPAPWEKEFLHPLFAMAGMVFAIVDQSKFSVKETETYAPTLLAIGVAPERIRIVVNRYTPKLASLREIEQAFCTGFKKGIALPKVVAAIPEGWEKQVKAGYKGKLLHREEWLKAAREAVGRISFPEEGMEKRTEKKRGGLFAWFRT